MPDLDELNDALDENAESSSSDSSSSSSEYPEYPYARQSPTTMVRGRLEEGSLGFTGSIKDEQNITEEWGGDLALTLHDPEIEVGHIYENVAREDGNLARESDDAETVTDFKVVDMENTDTEKSYGPDGENGISYRNNDFISEEVDSFDEVGDSSDASTTETTSSGEDAVTFFVSNAAGRFLAQALDCNGGVSAYESEQGNTRGLVEFPPDDSDKDERMARVPQLREDLEGEEVTIYIRTRETENGNTMHVGHALYGDWAEYDDIGEAEIGRVTNYEAPEYDSYLYWDENRYTNEDSSDTSSADDAPTADEFDLGGGDAAGDDESGLTAAEQAFVDAQVARITDGDGTREGVMETFAADVQANVDNGNLPESADAEELEAAVAEAL